MSRTTIATVGGLIMLGCVVALLPAQESSRRTASKYRMTPSGIPTVERPAAEPPPLTPPTQRAFEPAGSLPAEINGQSDQLVSPESAPLTETDDSQLHSVLKRSKPAMLYESPAPPAAPALSSRTSAAASGEGSRRTTTTPSPATSRSTAPTAGTSPRSIRDFAMGGKSAALKVEIAGPQGVTVGKPAAYVVNLNNDSDATAEEVQVRISLPAWVTVQSTQPTVGDAAVQGDAQGGSRLVWSIPRVVPRANEVLKLQLVTREADGFDLSVEWAARPAAARAAIVVKQPQLALTLAGPADMIFGEEKTFTLAVSNPGTGDAEHVMVSVAAGSSPPQQFDAGTIPAGHKKEVPLAVVASQAGAIELQISAVAEGAVETRTTGKINVKKAEVGLAIDGPPLKYAGSEAIYLLTVGNTGTAAADTINLTLALPPGAKYLSGIDGATANAGGLKWKIATLAPGTERTYEVRLQLGTAGTNRIVVQSQAAASGTATSAMETEVEAVSNLKLVVNDPSGPTPTGESAVYELQVMNRGSQAARQVKIVMQFSDGVEPVSFEGCEARIVPGQLLCQPLSQLGPGEQATVRVKAKAQQAGSHHFRVEVTSADGDARLVSEGTTRFFVETDRGGPAASTARKPSLLPSPSVPGMLR